MRETAAMEFGVLAFSSLFAMINPVSAAPIFIQLTQRQANRRRRTALNASLTALITLGLFASGGGAIFSFFGITVPAFQIAGGILFTISGIRVLQGLPEHEEVGDDENADPSIVPIGIPLIAGAGAISTVMVLAGQARNQFYWAALALAILANAVLTYVVLAGSPAIVKRMGASGQAVLSKVMGLLTAVIGVQFILNGGSTVVIDLIHQLRR